MSQLEKKITIAAPISLLLNGPKESCNNFIEELVSEQLIDWSDIKIIRPEDSAGKTRVISIAQIREAQSFINLTPVAKHKLLVIEDASSMPVAAANALLKTLEEPPSYAMIVLFSSGGNLLPTITSRCRIINLWQGENIAQNRWDFDKIIIAPFYEQSQLVAALAEEQQGLDFLNEMESWARVRMRQSRDVKATKMIKDIIESKQELRRNVTVRIVLETLLLKSKYNV